MGRVLCGGYELPDVGRVLRGYDRILITAPDGLKGIYKCIVEEYLEYLRDKEVFLSTHPSYGACDLPISEINSIRPQIVLHIGHNEYPYTSYSLDTRIIYIPARFTRRPDEGELELITERLLDDGYRRVGLVSTIQHTHILPMIKGYIEARNIEAVVGRPGIPGMEEGQILGCELSAALKIRDVVDAYLVVAGGEFHALGVYLATRKPVYIYNPYRGTIRNYTRDGYRVLAKRYYVVEDVRNKPYRSLGLITGSSPGQYRPLMIKALAVRSREKGYSPVFISSSHLDMDRMIAIDNGLGLDFYVVTSCPRIPIDDLSGFYKPVLTPGELRMILEDKMEYIFPW